MATINSVLGPLDTEELGFTLPHEHLIDSSAGIRDTYYELEFRDQALDMALESFNEARAAESTPSSKFLLWTWGGMSSS